MDPDFNYFMTEVIVNVLPVYDLTEFVDSTDFEEVLETEYSLDPMWIDFDVDFDAITTEELKEMGYF
jgi:hypothetical protein